MTFFLEDIEGFGKELLLSLIKCYGSKQISKILDVKKGVDQENLRIQEFQDEENKSKVFNGQI